MIAVSRDQKYCLIQGLESRQCKQRFHGKYLDQNMHNNKKNQQA